MMLRLSSFLSVCLLLAGRLRRVIITTANRAVLNCSVYPPNGQIRNNNNNTERKIVEVVCIRLIGPELKTCRAKMVQIDGRCSDRPSQAPARFSASAMPSVHGAHATRAPSTPRIFRDGARPISDPEDEAALAG